MVKNFLSRFLMTASVLSFSSVAVLAVSDSDDSAFEDLQSWGRLHRVPTVSASNGEDSSSESGSESDRSCGMEITSDWESEDENLSTALAPKLVASGAGPADIDAKRASIVENNRNPETGLTSEGYSCLRNTFNNTTTFNRYLKDNNLYDQVSKLTTWGKKRRADIEKVCRAENRELTLKEEEEVLATFAHTQRPTHSYANWKREVENRAAQKGPRKRSGQTQANEPKRQAVIPPETYDEEEELCRGVVPSIVAKNRDSETGLPSEAH